jgi:hypothetical protein
MNHHIVDNHIHQLEEFQQLEHMLDLDFHLDNYLMLHREDLN